MECLISYNRPLIFVLNAAYYIGCHIVSGLPAAVGCNLHETGQFLYRPKFIFNKYSLIFFSVKILFKALYFMTFNNNTSIICKSMGSNVQYII